MREVLQDGYLPFTYGPGNRDNSNDVSAEFYCHTDVLNYDNYDRIDGIAVDKTYYCVAFNHKIVEPQPLVCEPFTDLITNGSFENEVVTRTIKWELFPSVLGWDITKVSNDSLSSLELHRGWQGNVAADGLQYAELDGDSSTRVTQIIPTIVGDLYTLSWAFAPRQVTSAVQNELKVFVNGVEVFVNGPTVGMGVLAQSDWERSSYAFVASTSSAVIRFENGGPSNSFGTFLDDVEMYCTTPIIPPTEEDTYRIQGYVWHDENENTLWEQEGEQDDLELPLIGWKINITNGSQSYSTTTDETGAYYFDVTAGTWTITEELENGWDHTNVSEYVVTVPEVSTVTFLDTVQQFFLPVAYAAVIDIFGDYNFGNSLVPVIITSTGGGGAVSLSAGRLNIDDTDTVVEEEFGTGGDFPLTGQVLGDQVSVIPIGAPNTGRGGVAPSTQTNVLALFAVLVLLSGITLLRKAESSHS
jgi:hypothetical protein